MFLNQFYPLVPRDDLPQTIAGLASHFGAIVSTSLALYWPFVLLSALSMRKSFREAWSGSGSNLMMHPYVNVIRMHLMIFVMAGSVNAGLGDYVLYAAMILYFFPFGVLFRGRKQRARTDDDGLVESTLARSG
jgi:L-asparagine transporter-like permease